MTRTFKITLLFFSAITQCLNFNTMTVKENKQLSKLYYLNKNTQSVQFVIVKGYKCFNYFLCHHRPDGLTQWKRRRRMYYYMLKPLMKTDRLEIRRKREIFDITRNQIGDKEWARSALSSPQIRLSLLSKFKEQWPIDRWKKYGFYTDEYLPLINRHWLRFPPPDPAINYVLGTLYIVMMIVGCSGNALVLYMYFKCRSLRTPGNILVANLALSDFFMLAKTPVFIFNSFHFGPALGKPGCIIYGFLGGLTGATSIATLSAIALDRYWAVVRPLEPLRALTTVRAKLLATGAWIYAALFSSIPAFDFGYGHYVPEGYLTSCSFDYLTEETPPRYFILVFFCAAWVAPFCTISFCYLSIFREVVFKRNISTSNQEQRLSSRHVKERAKRRAEIKLAILVIAVIALFFISWTPYAVVALLGISGKRELITPISSMIPALFCKTAACVNPFIYIITHPKFRIEFKKMLYRDKSRRMGGTGGTLKTGYTTEMSKTKRPSKDLSNTDVEVVEMRNIPYKNEEDSQKLSKVQTISSTVAERQDSLRSMSMKSFEENVVSPPSWYAKPQFAKKKSFQRKSTKSVISFKPDPSA
ncbi:hypothetical protein ACJJTC_008294 [Scirpophaga incertulas]